MSHMLAENHNACSREGGETFKLRGGRHCCVHRWVKANTQHNNKLLLLKLRVLVGRKLFEIVVS